MVHSIQSLTDICRDNNTDLQGAEIQHDGLEAREEFYYYGQSYLQLQRKEYRLLYILHLIRDEEEITLRESCRHHNQQTLGIAGVGDSRAGRARYEDKD